MDDDGSAERPEPDHRWIDLTDGLQTSSSAVVADDDTDDTGPVLDAED